tara:strand:+ start:605 stop:1546 length:942 start_codon:yes stop_codon:yes gene_type:complete
MKILVTGGCGYVGSVLTNHLLKENHKVTVIDTQWFGNYLKKHPNLINKKIDIRNFPEKILKNVDVVFHLANIANDPSVELNPELAWEVNCLGTQKLIEKCIKNKVKKFIFASSGSVYGIKKEKHVTEDLDLVPISTYNKTKMVAERILLSYSNYIENFIIRPATVCGISPRMRFDVSVNMLTLHALKKKKITVFGGNQIRPNIHIDDLINLYKFIINNKNFKAGIYNAGFENISILDIAKKINKKIKSDIIILPSNDPRSYRQNSDKLLKTGFKQKYNVELAIEQIIQEYNRNPNIENLKSYTVKWMKKIKAK